MFATMDKKVAKDDTQICCKLVMFIVLPGNPLKLYNAMDEEWLQKRKNRSRKKRSKLTVQRSKSRRRRLAKEDLYTIVKHAIDHFQVNWI
jgi:nitrate reductase cytochrome c-type subunit